MIPRRELVSLLAYVEMGSHKAAAYRLGISESAARQRVSQLIRRVEATNAAQAVWRLRHDLEAESQVPRGHRGVPPSDRSVSMERSNGVDDGSRSQATYATLTVLAAGRWTTSLGHAAGSAIDDD